ncbi:histamine H4 receptor-like [Patiria miniata]|uniref:G-protein coupled receptors family 1 profile domain-containing protein n=1 Tax=Patiria miniata TaxID=46514 RepID=A0A913Z5H7_PATMI|nr:histamine H4 receptor-like [Patiria miniata]
MMENPSRTTMMANSTAQSHPGIDTLGTSLHSTDHAALTGVNVLIGILGILGNSTVILVYLVNPKMTRSLTSVFIFHQSFIDLVSSFIFLAIRLDRWRPLLSSSAAGIFCKLWYSEYLLWVLVMTSTLNLLLVSMERYVCIAHAVFHRNHFTRKKAKFSMLIAWLFSLAYQAYWAVVSIAVDGKCEPRWISGAMQWFFGILTFCVEYLIPLVLMTFAYTSIISRLNQRRRVSALYEASAYNLNTEGKSETSLSDSNSTGRTQPASPRPITSSSTTARQDMYSEAKRNVAKTLCIVFATYVICWTPTELEYLVYNLGGSLDFDGTFHRVTVVLVLCNMCVNPIIYALKYREFQKSLKRLLATCSDRVTRRHLTSQAGSDTEQFKLNKLSRSPLPPIKRAHNQADNLAMSDEFQNVIINVDKS